MNAPQELILALPGRPALTSKEDIAACSLNVLLISDEQQRGKILEVSKICGETP